jgi:hypothetical protein
MAFAKAHPGTVVGAPSWGTFVGGLGGTHGEKLTVFSCSLLSTQHPDARTPGDTGVLEMN